MEKKENKKPMIGIILSIIAGIIILLVGASIYSTTGNLLQTMQEQNPEVTEEQLNLTMATYQAISIIAIISGIFVLIGAFLGYRDRKEIGAILILIFSSFLSFLGILGIIGGILIFRNR